MAYGTTRMLMDFFRPSAWEYWRKRGTLTEIDQVITNEMASGKITQILGIFAKLSEFNNRVSAAYAGQKNLEILFKNPEKFKRLVPELASAYGKEAQDYATEIANVTQFRYGKEETPAAFDNSIGNLYYQYNTFTLKQAEFVLDMWEKQRTKDLWKDFQKAAGDGKVPEYFEQLTQGERGELFRFVVNVAIMQFLLSLIGLSFWDLLSKGLIPNQIEGAQKMVVGLKDGNTDMMKEGLWQMMIPPGIQLIIDFAKYGIKAQISNMRVVKQVDLLRAAITGKTAEVKSREGKVVAKLTPEQALQEAVFGSKSKTSVANSKSWDLVNRLESKYENVRKQAQKLLKQKKVNEAKNLVKIYNNWAKLRIKELKALKAIDIRIKDLIKKDEKWIVDSDDFYDWKLKAKEL